MPRVGRIITNHGNSNTNTSFHHVLMARLGAVSSPTRSEETKGLQEEFKKPEQYRQFCTINHVIPKTTLKEEIRELNRKLDEVKALYKQEKKRLSKSPKDGSGAKDGAVSRDDEEEGEEFESQKLHKVRIHVTEFE